MGREVIRMLGEGGGGSVCCVERVKGNDKENERLEKRARNKGNKKNKRRICGSEEKGED